MNIALPAVAGAFALYPLFCGVSSIERQLCAFYTGNGINRKTRFIFPDLLFVGKSDFRRFGKICI